MVKLASIIGHLRMLGGKALIASGHRLLGLSPGDGWNGLTGLRARTVLDIGACGGELAERELLKAFPDALIHCFEPHPRNFARLETVARRHARIHAYPIALGDRNATVDMQFNPGSPSSSSLLRQTERNVELFPFLEETQPAPVQQCRLDEWAGEAGRSLEGPLVIKMDVQGFETRVIEGGMETFARADGVVLEVSLARLYEDQASFADLHAILSSLGFRFVGTRDQFFGKQGEVIYLDACFLRDQGWRKNVGIGACPESVLPV